MNRKTSQTILLFITMITHSNAIGFMEFSSEEYLAKTAAQKQDQIWDAITNDRESTDWFGALTVGRQLLTEAFSPTFFTKGDEMPQKRGIFSIFGTRDKIIHTVGAVGKVKLEAVDDLPESHQFTGIFKGADKGFLRASLASAAEEENTKPGIALKFLRDGIDSANMVAMYGIQGQESHNFFANDMTNPIPVIQTKDADMVTTLGMKAFHRMTEYIFQVGVSNMAKFDQAGAEEPAPKFPFALRFQPTGEFTTTGDVIPDLTTIPANSKLFEVYAMDKPAQLGGTERHIASLILEGSLTTSKWGDQKMFFRHQLMDEDLELEPTWEPYAHRFNGPKDATSVKLMAGFGHGTAVAGSGSGCPFANLWQ